MALARNKGYTVVKNYVGLSEKVARGMTENVLNGKIAVDEHDSNVVREIFRLYTQASELPMDW